MNTKTKQKLVDLLYKGSDPLEGFAYDKSEVDTQGWNSEHQYYFDALAELDIKVVVECGVWKGRSVLTIASELKKRNIDACVVAIDTFLGCHILWQVREWQHSLRRNHEGRPEYYKTFYANVIENGLSDYVLPVHLDTRSGIRLLRDMGVGVDLFLHDASHQSPDVREDLHCAWEIIRPGGWLLVDDYVDTKLPKGHANNFDDLMRDCQMFSEDVKRELHSIAPKAKFIK